MGQPSLQTSFREGKDELIWFDVLLGLYDMLIEYDLMDELRVDFINYCIFYTFEKLKHIDLQEGLVEIGESAFVSCNICCKVTICCYDALHSLHFYKNLCELFP